MPTYLRPSWKSQFVKVDWPLKERWAHPYLCPDIQSQVMGLSLELWVGQVTRPHRREPDPSEQGRPVGRTDAGEVSLEKSIVWNGPGRAPLLSEIWGAERAGPGALIQGKDEKNFRAQRVSCRGSRWDPGSERTWEEALHSSQRGGLAGVTCTAGQEQNPQRELGVQDGCNGLVSLEKTALRDRLWDKLLFYVNNQTPEAERNLNAPIVAVCLIGEGEKLRQWQGLAQVGPNPNPTKHLNMRLTSSFQLDFSCV